MIAVFICVIVMEGVISTYLIRYIENPLYASAIGALVGGAVALPFTYQYFNVPWGYATLMWSGVALMISLTLNALAAYLHEDDELKHIIRQSNIAIVVITLFVLAPLSEEIIFRGVLFTGLIQFMPLAVAIVVDGFIFAILHIGAYWQNSMTYKIIHLIGIFILGSILAYTFSIYHSLTLNTIVHAVANIPGLIFVYRDIATIHRTL
ncbi:CPBP family intramembrane glutamic endopeptidase [Zhurongbacter thermophilus]